ncbi:hypothetical protein COCVIDRAFT_39392 [Bipolaris victoriae FI3]|uniref:Uncharacterized protein n=1 Tax=Bipolaris victoriae (strain FI3) TaxID=930091 RepID=W7ELL0_BIPV3|nr:hypothetical protein COCVIDRAFT_39392 [Bipolaris victoriae FI3]
MSSPLVNLPSRPERACIRNSETIAVTETGFQYVRRRCLKRAKERRRQQTMQEGVLKPALSKPSELPKDPISVYFQEEAEKKDGASCVFLLWGSENSESFKTWAVDIPITDVEDNEDEIFDLLQKKYHKQLGLSQIFLPFRKFRRLKPVTFRLICRDSERFLAFVQPIDLDGLHKSYTEQQKNAMKAIKLIAYSYSNDFPEHCYRDKDGEYNHCNVDCPTHTSEDSDDSSCPFEEWDWVNDHINWIQTAPFLSCYFRNPAGAKSQRILSGLNSHRFIHRYRSIYFPVDEFRFQNRYLELTGLYVETAWCPVKSGIAFLSILLPSIVIGGRFFWGSWEVAFGAGSFIIALPMLALAVLSRYDA